MLSAKCQVGKETGSVRVAISDRLSRKGLGEKVFFSKDLKEVRELAVEVPSEGAVGAAGRGSTGCGGDCAWLVQGVTRRLLRLQQEELAGRLERALGFTW